MFDYFVQFVGKSDPPNRFWRVENKEILKAEKLLGYKFPSELRVFYKEIGYGFFAQGIQEKKRDRSLVNGILSPGEIADLLLNKDNLVRPYEGFMAGVMPFFDVGESTYLVLRPESKNPNRVYWPDGKQRITNDLQEFFEQLHQKASFYRD